MAGVNLVCVLGNLGKDPEVRYTADGKAVATLSVATSETWTDKQSGEKREDTEWHRVVVWGQQAEHCGKYLAKGRTVHITGKLKTRDWEDKDGIKRYTTEINADRVTFVGGQGQGGGSRPPHPAEEGAPPRAQAQQQSRAPQGAAHHGSALDDIPF